MSRSVFFLLAVALFVSSLGLVVAQYLARSRFADLEVARQDAHALEMESARLGNELRHLAQPATVVAVARNWGMKDISPDDVVVLPVPSAPVGAKVEGAQ
jgi:cell division protein FtsL